MSQIIHSHLTDATLDKLQHELLDFAAIQAKHHAEQADQLQKDQFIFGFFEVVKKKVQKVIFEKLSSVLAVSAMVVATQLKKESAEKIKVLTATKNFGELAINDIRHHPEYSPNIVVTNVTMQTWVWIPLAVLGIAEAYFVYDALLLSGMGLAVSILSFVCIAVCMIAGNHYAAIQIKKLASRTHRNVLIATLGVSIFFAFYAIAILRVGAIKAAAARSMQPQGYISIPSDNLPFTLGCISTFIFLIGFAISYHYAKSKKENKLLTLVTKEQELFNKNTALDTQIKAIELETKTSVVDAYNRYEKALLYLKQLKSIAAIAHAKYVSTYCNFKSGEPIPAFMQEEPDYKFEDFIPKS